MKKIKVVHLVSGGLSGGAARGAYWLHKGLLERGVNSHVVTNHHNDLGDPTVTSLSSSKITRLVCLFVSKLDSLFLTLFPKRTKAIFSTGFFGINYKSNRFVKDADIIHLHWINGLVSTRSLKDIDKPLVWSIRDMWPITGGCHYSLDCNKYKSGCGDCPQLNSGFIGDFTSFAVKSKRKAYKSVVPVGISQWMSEEINKSCVFGGGRAVTIDNNIDCSIFFPINKLLAREALGVDTEKKIILAGSTSVNDYYKGFSLFLESLEYLDKNKYLICVFGGSASSVLDATGFEYKVLGYLNDDISMRLAYNAADLFVAPSVQEAFGKTLVESMACRTPVVCFDATGPSCIVENKIDGYKAKPYESEDLARGIDWVAFESDYKSLCDSARESALNRFDSLVIADKYISLYSDLVSKDLK